MEDGTELSIAGEDLAKLRPVDRNRLLSFIHHEMHQLANHRGMKRVPPPGPGQYEDGLRQGSATRRQRDGRCVTRFQPDINVHTDDLKASGRHASSSPKRVEGETPAGGEVAQGNSPTSPSQVPKLPPVPSPRSKQPGPTLSGRHMDHEDRRRRDYAGIAPGMYKPEKPTRDATQPISMKFRGKSQIAMQDAAQKPGPGSYITKAGAFPYEKPSNRMHPTCRKKVHTMRVPGPGAYAPET